MHHTLSPHIMPYVSRLTKRLTLTACVMIACVMAGCGHVPLKEEPLPIAVPKSYSITTTAANHPEKRPPWWTSFNDPHLSVLIEKALSGNFSIRQAEARVRQALAAFRAADVLHKPELDGGISGRGSRFADGDHSETYRLALDLSWEIDLWERLSSSARAAALEHQAKEAATRDLALLVASQVATAYFGIIEDTLTLQLLQHQIGTNQTIMELVRLRVAHGQSSLVDLYQQKLQLTALKAQLPLVTQRRIEKANRLAILTGVPPDSTIPATAGDLPTPLHLPATGIPSDLLLRRFDLRQLHNELFAADQRLAVAIADRLPKIRLVGSAGVSGPALNAENFFISLLGEAAAPLFDWDRRKQEVERSRAVVEEKIAAYAMRFLQAMEEVETGLQTESMQRRSIDAIATQVKTARDTYREAKNRYLQGITDYLPVITALQALQRSEQNLLHARGQLVANRVHIFRALGGAPLARLAFTRKPDTPPEK